MIAHPPPIHAVPVAAINYDRLLWAISQVESGENWNIPGGALCYTTTAWQEDAGLLPYKLAQFKPQAYICGRIRLARIQATCVRFGVKPTPELMAHAWNKGLSHAMRKSKTGKFSDYAQRCANLYYDNQN